MSKLLRCSIILWVLATATLLAQDLPGGSELQEPDIPIIEDIPTSGGEAPPPPPMPGPGATTQPSTSNLPPPVQSGPQHSQGGKSPSTSQQPSSGNVEVAPETSVEINGRAVPNINDQFTKNYHFEALFSSKPWSVHWFAPDMGILRVTTLEQPNSMPRGGVIKWQKDAVGNPMAILRARVLFPRLKGPDAISSPEPLTSVPMIISQAVVFYVRPDGWLASASPLQVVVGEGSQGLTLVPLSRGQGVWRAIVGRSGIYVENFVGAGLAAARTEIYQFFRDEEVRLFTQGNSDVVFYLRAVNE